MRELRVRMETPIRMAEFADPGVGPKTMARRYGFPDDISGCYVFMEGVDPIHVGISRHVFARLSQHVERGDHFTATLAYRMANHDAPHDKFAAQAMADPEFRTVFEKRQEYLLTLNAAVVEIPNPLELYVFEAYTAMELDTGQWNTFETHQAELTPGIVRPSLGGSRGRAKRRCANCDFPVVCRQDTQSFVSN